MITITVLLLVAALVVFFLAAINVSGGRINLVAMGLFLVTLAYLLGAGMILR